MDTNAGGHYIDKYNKANARPAVVVCRVEHRCNAQRNVDALRALNWCGAMGNHRLLLYFYRAATVVSAEGSALWGCVTTCRSLLTRRQGAIMLLSPHRAVLTGGSAVETRAVPAHR